MKKEIIKQVKETIYFCDSCDKELDLQSSMSVTIVKNAGREGKKAVLFFHSDCLLEHLSKTFVIQE